MVTKIHIELMLVKKTTTTKTNCAVEWVLKLYFKKFFRVVCFSSVTTILSREKNYDFVKKNELFKQLSS